jgi:circadian clock protein KaiB
MNMNSYILKLYITGQTPRSAQAIANLQYICAEWLNDQCEVTVVDVLEQPDLAEQDRVLATPTLIKVSPPPSRRVIGDLSDIEKVLWGLGLGAVPHAPQPSL